MTNRRKFLQGSGAALIGSAVSSILPGCAGAPELRKPIGRVMIIGAGYGGQTAAKYLRMWSAGSIEVMLVDREPTFISCPMSNLVIGGSRTLAEITRSRNRLKEYGVQLLTDEVTAVDHAKKIVKFKDRYADMGYDRLIVSPGVDLMYEALPGMKSPNAQSQVLHAWKAGPQTVALRKQLESMPGNGVFVISIPLAPYRCPPGPYERVCQVAHYFKQAKPKARIIVLDANENITSKGPLFRAAWNQLYKGMIEYRPNAEVKDVDVRGKTLKTDFDSIKGDVLNVLPPMRAADIARSTGLINANNRWCGVDWLSMESTAVPGVHVLGDATLSAPAMPKSGHLANQHGKLAAAAIIEIMNGRQPNQAPVIANTCYSFVSDKEVIHVSSVHQYDAKQKTLVTVPGAGGVSAQRNEIEGAYGWAWAQNIWSDMLG
ncbi:MAG: flavocytochrome C [Betaproteobacteria bacterium RIFCSPLOWO2_02_FULL_62_17]|nr:MAG: flavocytochrome C [Betaproteobacteria bacterium RIFCSPLOWO2_02_FULL_62_17]